MIPADPARRTLALIYHAELLLTQSAQVSHEALRHACVSGAVALTAQSLAALLTALAAPQRMAPGHWVDMLTALPDSLQERRLLERALLAAEGELYPLHLMIEQQRIGQASAPAVSEVFATTTSVSSDAELLAPLIKRLGQLAQDLLSSSQCW